MVLSLPKIIRIPFGKAPRRFNCERRKKTERRLEAKKPVLLSENVVYRRATSSASFETNGAPPISSSFCSEGPICGYFSVRGDLPLGATIRSLPPMNITHTAKRIGRSSASYSGNSLSGSAQYAALLRPTGSLFEIYRGHAQAIIRGESLQLRLSNGFLACNRAEDPVGVSGRPSASTNCMRMH